MYDVEIYRPDVRELSMFHYFIPVTDPRRVYTCILNLTGNHDLACEVSGWSEVSEVGEIFEDDQIIAEIVERV